MKNITPSLLCAIGLITFLVTSCTVDPPSMMVSQPDLIKMPPFQATVLRVENGNLLTGGNQVDANWVAANFKTADGRRITIGGPSASVEMIAFIRSLQKRQTFTLPDSFIAFQKSQAGRKQ
jgi:hypothetical protein